jgi:hypothetical protein
MPAGLLASVPDVCQVSHLRRGRASERSNVAELGLADVRLGPLKPDLVVVRHEGDALFSEPDPDSAERIRTDNARGVWHLIS